jgi:YjbE family integral membrane protein
METLIPTLDLQQLTTPAFYSALFAIILIDLALAGDNALVIGLAARQVPVHMQKKVLMWGSITAVVVRAVFTLFVVWLLKIPGFMLAGGLVLLYIAHRLVQPQDTEASSHRIAAGTSMRQAIASIVVADTAMGIENVIAIGGAAHGSVVLVVLGLLISVPIIMFGSQLVLRLVGRYPHIITMGGALLAWTAVKMIFGEPLIKAWSESQPWVKLPIYLLAIALVTVPTIWRTLSKPDQKRWSALVFVIAWLMVFDALEAMVGMHPMFENGWHIGEEVLDLVMWVGWIPVVLAWRQLRALK